MKREEDSEEEDEKTGGEEEGIMGSRILARLAFSVQLDGNPLKVHRKFFLFLFLKARVR